VNSSAALIRTSIRRWPLWRRNLLNFQEILPASS
jgi:hypothetical protein